MDKYRLIYHTEKKGTSPFDRAITKIVKDENVCIVCPYIGLDYFNRITSLANTWRLVTDVQEWIFSQNKTSRKNIKNFVLENLQFIHHYPDIHAKVVVADNKAFVGSSNFTDKGITERVELGVLIEEKEHVDELKKWFCDLWVESDVVDSQNLEKYASSIRSSPSRYTNKPKSSLPSKIVPIRSKLVEVKGSIQDIIKSNPDSHKRLVETIRKIALDRRWINDYFDLAKEMIEFTGLRSDDPRLVISIPSYKKIPVHIGQRYVLLSEYNGVIGLIMPLDYDPRNYNKDRVIRAYDEGDEKYFYNTKGVQEARWIEFGRKNKVEFSEGVKNYWRQAILSELNRCKLSGRKKFHEPVAYEAVMNSSYRNKLLDEVFSKSV